MKLKREIKGSYTIEAAVIMPLVLWVIVIIMYGAYFGYDVCCVQQGTYIAALRGEQQGGSSSVKQQTAAQRLEQYIREELWMVENMECRAETEYRSVRTWVKGNLHVPVDHHLFQTLWKLEAQSQVDRLRPVTFIRTCNKAESMGEWLQTGGADS